MPEKKSPVFDEWDTVQQHISTKFRRVRSQIPVSDQKVVNGIRIVDDELTVWKPIKSAAAEEANDDSENLMQQSVVGEELEPGLVQFFRNIPHQSAALRPFRHIIEAGGPVFLNVHAVQATHNTQNPVVN